jgi:hypothetical protein
VSDVVFSLHNSMRLLLFDVRLLGVTL